MSEANSLRVRRHVFHRESTARNVCVYRLYDDQGYPTRHGACVGALSLAHFSVSEKRHMSEYNAATYPVMVRDLVLIYGLVLYNRLEVVTKLNVLFTKLTVAVRLK